MADDTTDNQSSAETTQTSDASSGGGDAQGNVADTGTDADQTADSSLLGSADAAAGDGSDGEGGGKDDQDGGDGDGKADAQAEGPPETYELKVTVQGEDGKDQDVPIDAELLTKATPVLKELGLTNEQANKVASLVPEIQSRILQTQADDFSALKADWAKEIKADPEFGGAKWKETEANAAKALDTFGAPSVKDKDGNETNPFRNLLNESGFGNHPEMIRMFAKIGKQLGEGEFVRGDGARAEKQDRVRVLYPDDKPKEVKQQ